MTALQTAVTAAAPTLPPEHSKLTVNALTAEVADDWRSGSYD
jgi:hypothetical protein